MKPLELTDEDSFSAEVLGAESPVLVDFWSPTCPHCLRLNPEFALACEEKQEDMKFVKVSAAGARQLFIDYQVRGVPTLILFRNGVEIARREGAMGATEILTWIKESLI